MTNKESNMILYEKLQIIINRAKKSNKENFSQEDIFAAIDLFEKPEHTFQYMIFLDGLKTALINPNKTNWIDLAMSKMGPFLYEIIQYLYLYEENGEDLDSELNKEEIMELFTKYKRSLCSLNSYFMKRHAELSKFDNIGISYKNTKKDKGKS